MTRVLAGADAGGSKTVAAVARDQVEVARASGAGAAVRPDRAMSAAATIARVVRTALHQVGHLRAHVLVVGAAGVGRDEERRALRDSLRVEDLADRLEVRTDLDIALEAAMGEGPGIILLAGTGSVAAARLADGKIIRQGGYGWQMGDEGSGYALGRAALRAAGRARDGRGSATGLLDALLRFTRSADFPALVRWSAAAEPPEVATLAPLVLAAAREQDATARAILDRAGAELAAHVTTLIPRLPKSGPVPVAVGGGLLEDEGYRTAVTAILGRERRLRISPEPLDAVAGALAIARRLSEAPVV